MNNFKLNKGISLILAMAMVLTLLVSLAIPSYAAAGVTGYDSADDVVYKTSGSYIANWGAREEDCVFLSKYAQEFYTGKYVFEDMSKTQGGTGKNDAYKSALYGELKELMSRKHKYINSYKENNSLLKYTDCVMNDTAHISSFYSGKELSSTWGSGWNKEHTWPNSKGLEGSDEDDVMMIRPTATSENSGRGNTAYGEGSSYYNPNSESGGKHDLRGDCARITLYVYTRWGNTGRMWGTTGVMESLDVLLKWMEQDPVDTWEMGRNDAVQSITGTRNVFVDYPEYAWLLFGEDVPGDLVSPSGNKGTAGGNGNGNSGNNSGSNDTIQPDSDKVISVTGPLKGETVLPTGSVYVLGQTAHKDYYISTTTSKDRGVDLYVEESTKGYRIYFGSGANKTYIEMCEYQAGKGSLKLTKTPENYYTFDKDLGIYVYTVGSESYYLGTYTNKDGVTYDTISCSNMNYITGTNESKIGVSQFPLKLISIPGVTETVVPDVDTDGTDPIETTPTETTPIETTPTETTTPETTPTETTPTETTPIETTPIETDPDETKPDTKPEIGGSEAEGSKPSDDMDKTGGCGSVAGFGAVAIVIVCAAGLVTFKKKQD